MIDIVEEKLLQNIQSTIRKEIPQTVKVRLHETVTGWAEYEDV